MLQTVHDDDFFAVAAGEQLAWLDVKARQKYDTK